MKRTALFPDRFRLILFAVLMVIGLLGYWTTPAHAQGYIVKMGADSSLLVFEPKILKIKPGDTITWVNNKSYPHNFVFDDKNAPAEGAALAGSWSHRALSMQPNEEISVTFPADTPSGKYPYYCEPHRGAGMMAEIVVE